MGNAMRTLRIISAVLMAAGATMPLGSALAQGAEGIPGDRLVVPLPDVSGLDDAQATELAHELARANVITSNCPEYDVDDGAWQLMTGTTDALTRKLALDPITYDREYFRPAFAVMDDPQACADLGPGVQDTVDKLVAMGGGTKSAAQAAQQPALGAPTPGDDPQDSAAQDDASRNDAAN